MFNPERLPRQKADENIRFFLRRHWFTVLRLVTTLILVALIPVVLFLLVYYFAPDTLSHPTHLPLLVIGASVYYLAIWLIFFQEFLDYYLDTWIVTNQRIINIEQLGLFSRVASELNMHTVQDVTSKVKGVLHTFFDYGDLVIQTAGAEVVFQFKNIPEPDKVKRAILEMVDQQKKMHEVEVERQVLKESIK